MTKSAAIFRQIDEFTLPQSGVTVQIKKPDLLDIALAAKNGEMPSFLRQQVLDGLNGKQAATDNGEGLAITPDNAHEYRDFINQTCASALVWPVIVANNPNVDNGEILITDIPFMDRFAVVMHIMPQDAKSASSFRGEQGGDVAVSSDVQSLQPETVSSNGHSG